ncbi:hypothetical protein [Streptomyces justiciae]|uniref:Uncharacterized protein n=1 Tax=Streptomyces justiciae TaxID=2780140 RepID=A0ABU3M5D8_9ACTN|nr:hypothetical protein [Streptomyces justiciae]MDT7846705.1 hypothetical protein [Streptomyces justiciae]
MGGAHRGVSESQDERLLQVRLACPDITRSCDLQAEEYARKPLKGIAGFLREDLDAVTAGLTSRGVLASP